MGSYPHTILHVDPDDHSKVLRVEESTVTLPPAALRLTTVDELSQYGTLAVIRRSGFGDCILLQPALKELHRLLPELRIDLYILGHWVPPFADLDYLNAVRDIGSLNRDRYDRIIDVSSFPERSPDHLEIDRARLFGRAFGMDLSDIRVTLPVSEENLEFGEQWLQELEEPIVGLCPWSARRQSDWPHVAQFANLYKRHYGGSVALLTNKEIQPDWADKRTSVSMAQLGGILAHLNLLVTTDTGTLHYAFAVGTKRVAAMFGVASSKLRIPNQTNYWAHNPVDLPCHPCDMGRASFTCDVRCMDELSPETVIKAISPFMEGPRV